MVLLKKVTLSHIKLGYNLLVLEKSKEQMNVEDVIKFADDLVFAVTAKHLDSLQQAILKGAWNNQKYREIAEQQHRSEKYIKEVGFKLWKILSEVLGEELNKSNFKAALERRWRFSFVLRFGKAFIDDSSYDNFLSPETLDSELNFTQQKYWSSDNFGSYLLPEYSTHKLLTYSFQCNWGEAPEPTVVHGREQELSLLKQWILNDQCRLIGVLGISGIGKTSLIANLVSQIQDRFEYIFWRSLKSDLEFSNFQEDLTRFLFPLEKNDAESKDFLKLVEFFKKTRCLIIIDDIQQIFECGKLAGFYRAGYERYSYFIKCLGELSHNSCILIISREKLQEFSDLEGNDKPTRTLVLEEISSEAYQKILIEDNLGYLENSQTIYELCLGNPFFIKRVLTALKEIFNNRLIEFHKYKEIVLIESIKDKLEEIFSRLSPDEKQLLSALYKNHKPLSLDRIMREVNISQPLLFRTIQSLKKRFLIDIIEAEQENLLLMHPIIFQYAQHQRLQEEITE